MRSQFYIVAVLSVILLGQQPCYSFEYQDVIRKTASHLMGVTPAWRSLHDYVIAAGNPVVGKGKHPYTKGTKIPPSKVKVVKP